MKQRGKSCQPGGLVSGGMCKLDGDVGVGGVVMDVKSRKRVQTCQAQVSY